MKKEEIFKMPPLELAKWLDEHYGIELPDSINSIEELKVAGSMLGELTNAYSYMMSLLTQAKILVRMEKRKGKENKEIAEDMIDRKECIQNMADTLKMQYNAVSRMITVKKEIDDELKMTSGL